MARRGIIAGGNWIVDRVKIIDSWPEEEALATILEQTTSNGGSAYNILVDLSRLGADLPTEGVGIVGADFHGEAVLRECRDRAIGTRLLKKAPDASTSYTDVMTVQDTGKRTFFHQRGANDLLDVSNFDFVGTRAKMFHLGYLLLMEKLDKPDKTYGTRAGQVLAMASAAKLITSIDVVSEHASRFAEVVVPTLPQVDVSFMNESEAAACMGTAIRKDGKLDGHQLQRAAELLLQAGVRRWAIIHAAEGALALSREEAVWQGAVRLPDSVIKGSAGAGDAFAAGVLFGIHEDAPMAECLRYGVCAGAACVTHPTTSGGVAKLAKCMELGERLGFQS